MSQPPTDDGRDLCLFLTLPWELIAAIATHLDADDLYALGLCCRGCLPLARDPHLHKAICMRTLWQAALDQLATKSPISWRWEYLARRPRSSARQSIASIVPNRDVRPDNISKGIMSESTRTSQWLEATPGGGLEIVRGTVRGRDVIRRDSRVALLKGPIDSATPARIHKYANGDEVAFYVCPDNGPDVGWFRCSPHCPDAKFAGRVFTGPWDACLHEQHVPPRGYCPYGNDSEAAVFHAYVAAGLIGWDDAARSSYERLVAKRVNTKQSDLSALGSALAAPGNRAQDDDRSQPPPDSTDVAESPAVPRCPLSREPLCDTDDWGILSNGLLANQMKLAKWLDVNRNFGFSPIDPTTGEPVMPMIVPGAWRMQGLSSQWVRHAVARACHQMAVLIADGADLLTTQQEAAVLSLVAIDLLDAYTSAEGYEGKGADSSDSNHSGCRDNLGSDPNDNKDNRRIRLQRGDLYGVEASAKPNPRSSFQLAHIRDVVVPPESACAPRPEYVRMSMIRARLERVTWSDRVFAKDFFAGALLVACRFTRCRFSECIFVGATFRDCVFEECTFDRGFRQKGGRGGPLVRDVIDDDDDPSASRILTRLGCFRVNGVIQR